jgi:hypothetical protein
MKEGGRGSRGEERKAGRRKREKVRRARDE